jgi:NAD+ kinase
MRFIVLGIAGWAPESPEIAPLLKQIRDFGEVVLVDFTGEADLSPVEADFVVVFGGDGAILRSAHQMELVQRPVLAVNLGRLGFLAELGPAELGQALQRIAQGDYRITEHLMYLCEVFHEGQKTVERLGLNEVTVQTGPPYALMEVDLYVDGEWVTTYRCDGLILSTPAGSTAHNLSAGGPILRKDLQAFVICPISPHTLSHRPVVDSADRLYEMVIAGARGKPAVVTDGVVAANLVPRDLVRVRRAPVSFKTVSFPDRGYYRTLREKLGWGGKLDFVMISRRSQP